MPRVDGDFTTTTMRADVITRLLVLIAMLGFGGSSPAGAQDSDVQVMQEKESWERFSFYLNGGWQITEESFNELLSFPVYGEQAQFRAAHRTSNSVLIDVGGRIRIWRRLSIGFGYSETRKPDQTTVTGAVPHLLLLNNSRQIKPQQHNLVHRERSSHLQLAWTIPFKDRWSVAVSSGPSFFNVKQGLTTELVASEAGGPPFDAVNVDVGTGVAKVNGFGFNAGADLTFMVTPHIGVGVFCRYALATVDLPVADSTVPFDTGGVHSGAGVRVQF